MKETGYSPSEHMEAQDKMDKHKEGRKEATFYRNLLDNVYRTVINQASRSDVNEALGKVDLNTTDIKLKQFKYLDEGGLRKIVEEAAQSLAKATGKTVNLQFEVKSLAEMTPIQFHKYIEEQKASLIKD